ncbi:hypothetical protein JZ751_025846 [Albula glossodonta]|uniref:Palmdelphin n=1 Tax=Albula glossodonta TaxID=121402 RepID=A0A8T2NLC3_9TELE|nr:hypothetical protein JZ751_025846 [Albula glossodonta]
MEEAELMKERLQAITKKALREQWLQDGLTVQSMQEAEARRRQAQDNQQQAKLLQISIHRMEQEIGALERQEMMISTNEGFILKRLKAIEKSPQDIIKEAKSETKQEPVPYMHSPDVQKSYKPSPVKKQKSSELESKDQPKKHMFAMEINVQKDLRTGESQVLSTAAVTDREFQQKGVKVYDDGRKSIYALGSDGQVLPSGVDELSPAEVEELLRKASERKSKAGPDHHEPRFSSPYSSRKKAEQSLVDQQPHGMQEPHRRSPIAKTPPELRYMQSEGEGRSMGPHIPHSYTGRRDPANSWNYCSNGYDTGSTVNTQNGGQVHHYPEPRGDRPALFPDSKHRSRKSPRSANSKLSVLNALEATEPVTMIFMGYQRAEDVNERGPQGMGYEGAIRAELVVINDEDDGGHDTLRPHRPDSHRTLNSRGHDYTGTALSTGME